MSTPVSKNSLGNNLKIYFFPSLVTVLAMLIWRDVSELRNDVKSLLAQSNIDKTKIEMLERTLYGPNVPKKLVVLTDTSDRLLFKHEEIFDLNDHITKNS